ncbi:MAG: hypothetical protein NVSMB19_03070 [Vulcanimicrobiaceae bacterium]
MEESRLGAITPVVPARDVAAAIAFYTARLGFAEVWRTGTPAAAGGVRRDAAELHFFACDEPEIARWTSFRVRCTGVAALYERCRAADVVHPSGALHETPWQTREFAILDQDGVCVTFWEPSSPARPRPASAI